jgi:hypothetical protein
MTITDQVLGQHGLTREEYQRIVGHDRPDPDADRTGHVLGHVVGALQLQELARSFEDAADLR